MSTDIKRRLGLYLKNCLTTVSPSDAASHGAHLSLPETADPAGFEKVS